MKIHAFESADWSEAAAHGVSKESAISVVNKGLQSSEKLLPSLSKQLNIVIRPYLQAIIPEYSTGARTHDSEFIEIWFDKSIPHGAKKTLLSLKQTVFHEANHAARWNAIEEDYRLIEGAIFEGLATVFESHHACYQPLYGKYENDSIMHKWFGEIEAAGEDWNQRNKLFFDHPDGRRWMGYKTGTWLVDRAIEKSGKTVIDLTTVSADVIIKLAEVK